MSHKWRLNMKTSADTMLLIGMALLFAHGAIMRRASRLGYGKALRMSPRELATRIRSPWWGWALFVLGIGFGSLGLWLQWHG